MSNLQLFLAFHWAFTCIHIWLNIIIKNSALLGKHTASFYSRINLLSYISTDIKKNSIFLVPQTYFCITYLFLIVHILSILFIWFFCYRVNHNFQLLCKEEGSEKKCWQCLNPGIRSYIVIITCCFPPLSLVLALVKLHLVNLNLCFYPVAIW